MVAKQTMDKCELFRLTPIHRMGLNLVKLMGESLLLGCLNKIGTDWFQNLFRTLQPVMVPDLAFGLIIE